MEKMTKERLKAYRSNKAEILELDYTLQNRWKSDTMIGNDVIFDYSKGYPRPQCVEQFVEGVQDSLTHRIFRMLYIDGRKPIRQEQVAKSVHLDRSRISRKIDNYLKNAQKAQNAQL